VSRLLTIWTLPELDEEELALVLVEVEVASRATLLGRGRAAAVAARMLVTRTLEKYILKKIEIESLQMNEVKVFKERRSDSL
jgi:hypothetical protein